MASGNSAIAHNVSESFFGHVLAPYVARMFQFWSYSPSGMQAIKSLESLENKRLPIVLVHATDDICLPYYGAGAVYYGLKQAGHQNVYLVTKEGSRRHIEILSETESDRAIVKTILGAHGLGSTVHDAVIDQELQRYQPDHTQFRGVYEKLRFYEKLHTSIGATLTMVTVGYMLYMMNMYMNIAQLIRSSDKIEPLFSKRFA